VSLRLILGRAYGEVAPASVFSDTFYGDAMLQPGARMPLPDDHEDRGLYIVEGSISVAGQAFDAGRMMVFRPRDRITVAAGPTGARLIILGGATLGGPRFIWWNFVASSREKIEAAKEQWRKGDWGHGLFDLPPDDRDEFIPCRPHFRELAAATVGPTFDQGEQAMANAISIEKQTTRTTGRYVARVDGVEGEAELVFTVRGPALISADHTESPPSMRGTGAAMALVEHMIADARADHFGIVPLCPYVLAQYKKHPEWRDVMREASEAS